MATEVGDHLGSPQHVVGVVQTHGDRGGDRHGAAMAVVEDEEDMSQDGSDTMKTRLDCIGRERDAVRR